MPPRLGTPQQGSLSDPSAFAGVRQARRGGGPDPTESSNKGGCAIDVRWSELARAPWPPPRPTATTHEAEATRPLVREDGEKVAATSKVVEFARTVNR